MTHKSPYTSRVIFFVGGVKNMKHKNKSPENDHHRSRDFWLNYGIPAVTATVTTVLFRLLSDWLLL